MSSVFIPRLKGMLKDSVNALSPSMPFEEEDEELLATIVFDSMYTPSRVYHSMEHVFNLTENCAILEENPILVLSVLFHDVIYYSVDQNFQESQLEFLETVLALESGSEEAKDDEQSRPQLQQPLALASHAQEDPINDMVVRLFGLEAGMTLPKLGTNEFLSAIIGIRILSKWLTLPQLTQIAACIEGTIPFRPASSDGKTAMDRLYDRLVLVAPSQPEDWWVETIHLTATMANCDLCSFDSNNFDFFLDSTWSLIPEFNPSVMKENCSLQAYRDEFMALEKRTKFLNMTVPNIFQVFRDVPSQDEVSAKQAKAHENLDLSNDYAQVRRLQLMVLVEFVTLAGENPDTTPGRPFLQLVLPETPPHSEDEDDEVRRLLHHGRNAGFSWDPARCSLGVYLYDMLGKKEINTAVEVGKKQECGLLNHLPKDVVEVIATSLADLLPNRSDVLTQISNEGLVGEKVACTSSE